MGRCTSVRQILDECGLPGSGAYATIRRRMKLEGLDYKAFAKASLGRRQKKAKIPLTEVMVEESTYRRHLLKRRVIEEGLIEYRCAECGLDPEWRGKPLTLVIDHINGINNDHRRENLRFLCPNCNSQTPTFAGRNIGAGSNSNGSNKRCLDCETEIWRTSVRCQKCASLQREKQKRRRAEEPPYPFSGIV